MRPQISRLLCSTYSQLVDHPVTQGRPSVRGMELPVFFVRHTKPESSDGELRSCGNPHEARLIAAIAAYLIRQGYAESQITVLAPYCGQLQLLKRELRDRGIQHS